MHGIIADIFKINCILIFNFWALLCLRGTATYKTLEVLGPEHEFSVVNDQLKALPIMDKIIKDYHGRIVNFVQLPRFTFGKELQMHVMEIKPDTPFASPIDFEGTMQEAVLTVNDFLRRKYRANLLGTGMHPLLKLEETSIWPHRHRKIYEAYSEIFNLKRHGWLNIQSFQLNLPYANEKSGVLLHNLLAEVCAFLPAITASSPIYESKFGDSVDSRLRFYEQNQAEVPSVMGDVVPEYTSSFADYHEHIIGRYSSDLAAAGANKLVLGKEWVNSRGVIVRFDRKAVEIRVMDEQECVKSDVALSCFIRALLRGLMEEEPRILPHEALVRSYNSTVTHGLGAQVQHPYGKTAREVCERFLDDAWKNATKEEKQYLSIIQKRIRHGNLSETIRRRIEKRKQKTDMREAIINVYSRLIKSLVDNEPYF